MINVYRETEVSLANFQTDPRHPARAAARDPVGLAELDRLAFEDVSFTHQIGDGARRRRT